MALQNDSRLYTTGAVKFDTNPTVNLFAQLSAKKQAKEDALDEYYRKLPSTINDAGMRDQSIPGFNEEAGKMQGYWMQNKEAIRKGNTPQAFNYEKMFRELRQKVQEDKNAAKTDLELGKMRFSKENGYVFDDPDFIENLHQHNLSIFDPNHKSIDLGTAVIPPHPFDEAEQDKYYKSITSGMEAGKKYDYAKSYTNPKTGQVIVPTIDVLNDDQIKKAAEMAMQLTAVDKSKKLHFDKVLNTGSKKDWQIYQDAYSKYFDGMVSTPEQVAAADAIIKLSIPKKYAEEQEINYQQRQQDKRINISLNTNRPVQNTTQEGNAFDDLADADYTNFNVRSGTFYNKDGTPKNGSIFLTGNVIPASVKSALNSGGIDTKYLAKGVDAVIKDGQIQSISNKFIGTITRDAMGGVYQPKMDTEPLKGQRLQFGNKGNQPSKGGKQKTYKGLDKNGNPIFE